MNRGVTDRMAAVLLQLERDRCAALVAADRTRLEQLLHPGLIHVHAKGQVDSYESYMDGGGFGAHYVRVERFDDLRVQVLGETAVMTGRQLLEAVRKSSGERVRIDSQVMQVWVLEGSRWQQMAFQTTPTEMIVEPRMTQGARP